MLCAAIGKIAMFMYYFNILLSESDWITQTRPPFLIGL